MNKGHCKCYRYASFCNTVEGYEGLQGATRGWEGLQKIKKNYRGLHWVTGGYRGSQRVTESGDERKWLYLLGLISIKFHPPSNGHILTCDQAVIAGYNVSAAWCPTVDVNRGRVTRNSRQK